MNDDPHLLREAESFYRDLAAPAWHFWRDREGAFWRTPLGHAARPLMLKFGRLVVDDPRPQVRARAAAALGTMLLPFDTGVDDPGSWPEADAQMREARTQIEQAYSTQSVSTELRETIQCLVTALGDKDAVVRRASLCALGCAGPSAQDSLSAISHLAQDPDEEVQLWIRYCTANMMRLDGETLEYLASKMVDQSKADSLRQASSSAMVLLYGIDRLPAIPKILRAIELYDPIVSESAIGTIQMLLCSAPVGSPFVAPAVQALFRALQYQRLAGQAAGALFYIGPAAVPFLIDGVRNHPERLVRLYAARALGRIGPAAQEATEALAELREEIDDDGIVSSALSKIGASKGR